MHERPAIGICADGVDPAQRIYNNASEVALDSDADACDTVIGDIPHPPRISKPNPPREVVAITPIDFVVKILEFRKRLVHPPQFI